MLNTCNYLSARCTLCAKSHIGTQFHASLEINDLLPQFQDVLDGFVYGFDQGIPEHVVPGMRYFTPENHRSSALARDKIEESIKKELAAGRMFGPFTHDYVEKRFKFFRSNPLGAVVNGDGSVRPINDLSYPRNDSTIRSVNSFVSSDDFETTWDDFQTVSKFFAGEDRPLELALFDWEKAYRQIPTQMDQWRYLLVQDFEGNLLLDTRITFGGVAGCGSFRRPADAWNLIMRNHFRLVNIFRWVDDNLFVRFQGDKVSMEEVVIKSQELGVMTNRSKYSPFGNKQKFIGFIWNGVLKTVRLPDEKIAQRIAQIGVFLDLQQKFSYEQVEILAGRLNHVLYLLPHLKCHLNSLYRWLKSWIYRKARQFAPMDVVLDLKKWLDTLENFEPTRIINWGPPIDVGWVGDASTSFGIGILVGKKWAQFRLFEPGNTPGRIALLETIVYQQPQVERRQDKPRMDEDTRYLDSEQNAFNSQAGGVKRQQGGRAITWRAVRTGSEGSSGCGVACRLDANPGTGSFPGVSPSDLSDLRNRASCWNLSTMASISLLTIQDFTLMGKTLKHPSKVDLRVLSGWEQSTLKGHNSAVRKFLRYIRLKKPGFDLPASTEDIYGFCEWAGRGQDGDQEHTISATTLTKYVGSLKAWHMYHNTQFPLVSGKKVNLMMKGSAKLDAEQPKKEKAAVMIHDLLDLVTKLVEGTEEDLAIMDLILVAFWGMGRLGELTRAARGNEQDDGPRMTDVWFSSNEDAATLALRKAKTAAPGAIQYIRLSGLNNILCPVMALKRRYMKKCDMNCSVFGFPSSASWKTLTKYSVTTKTALIWGTTGRSGLSGHSF
ncbi:hypothetical protein MJO29_001215 [Puccinia striiformis f. sp. tritici]|nr:hypothetical protein MJO29_001215 [Puccinia striiformis f. sp. tritici]